MSAMLKTLKLVVNANPMKLIVYFVISLPLSFLPVMILHVERLVVDLAVSSATMSEIWISVGIMAAASLLLRILQLNQSLYLEFSLFNRIFIHMGKLLHEKIQNLELINFEQNSTYDKIHRGKNAQDFIAFSSSTFFLIVFGIISVLMISTLLFTFHPALVMVVILSGLPPFVSKYIEGKQKAILAKKNTGAVRAKEYVEQLFMSHKAVLEIKNLGAASYFQKFHANAVEQIQNNHREVNREVLRVDLLAKLVEFTARTLALVTVIQLVMAGQLSLGAFVAVLSSFQLTSELFKRLFTYVADISSLSQMAEPFFELLEIETVRGYTRLASINQIELLDASYSYVEGVERVLNHINLSLAQGEKIAIAGENGSGKTTLIKLMTGLLLTQKGRVLINGQPAQSYGSEHLFHHVGGVFQNFGRYSVPISENITMADIKKGLVRMKS